MSESGPTYEQAPFESETFEYIARNISASAARAAELSRRALARESMGAGVWGPSEMAASLGARAFAEGDRVQIDGATFVVTRATPRSLTVEEDDAQARERAARKAWEARILARLASPTEDDRAEAAQMAAWLRRTAGEVLPLR